MSTLVERRYQIEDSNGVRFEVIGWTDAWSRFLDMLARTELSGTFEEAGHHGEEHGG